LKREAVITKFPGTLLSKTNSKKIIVACQGEKKQKKKTYRHFININLEKDQAWIFLAQFYENRRHNAAWSTPGGCEIHNNLFTNPENIRVIIQCQMHVTTITSCFVQPPGTLCKTREGHVIYTKKERSHTFTKKQKTHLQFSEYSWIPQPSSPN
jgi:hypothetical protein